MKVDFEDLVPKAKNGDQQALERIAIQLQHLVASWLIKNWYKSPSCYDFADMVQEGVIYGVLSVNTYKPEKGMKAFSWVWDNAYYRLATLVRNMHYDKRRANQGCVSLDAKIVSNRYGRDNDDTSFYKIIDKKVQED
ncbi:MAG: hypothetical protein H6Q67_2294, partial [Firmicutes bacterium]|nr:hypothetical protein [Bacillota bacterium]